MSLRSPSAKKTRFSREGFEPLQGGMAPDGDATVDIPLEQVHTSYGGGGLHPQNSMTALRPSETQTSKRQFFRGRRVKTPQAGQRKGHVGYDGEEDTITTMGKIYNKILNFSIITKYLVYVAPLALAIAVPIIVGATVAKEAKIGGVRIVWFFAWVEVVWLSVWGSKIVAHYLPSIFQVLAGVVSSGVRKYSEVIRALEIPLSLVGWAVTSLATFMPIMTRNPTQRSLGKTSAKDWETIVQNVLAAATIAVRPQLHLISSTQR